MKKVISIICLVFGLLNANGQTLFQGTFSNPDLSDCILEFYSDSTFNAKSYRTVCNCTESYMQHGVFTKNADTITMVVNKEDSIVCKLVLLKDSVLVGLKTWQNWIKENKSQEDHISNFLLQFEQKNNIEFDYRIVTKSFYVNGQCKYWIQSLDGYTVETRYFESGQIRQIGKYKNGSKKGDWITYNSIGEVVKIAEY